MVSCPRETEFAGRGLISSVCSLASWSANAVLKEALSRTSAVQCKIFVFALQADLRGCFVGLPDLRLLVAPKVYDNWLFDMRRTCLLAFYCYQLLSSFTFLVFIV